MAGSATPSPPAAPVPRVEHAAPPRVPKSAPPGVATMSNDIMTPNAIRNQPRLHQRLTRNNNPFAILNDDNDDDEQDATDDTTVVASNCSQKPTWADPPHHITQANLPEPSPPSII